MDWAFVDYENMGSLEGLAISGYERMFVFCGPGNKRINLGKLPTDRFSSLEVIGVRSTGRNNPDFHMAFYLGRLHQVAVSRWYFTSSQ